MEERTERRGQSESQIVGEKKWQTCRCYRDQQKACRMAQASMEKLEHIGKNAGAALAKRKRNRAVCPEYQNMRGERVKMSESRTLARVRGIRAKAWRVKGGLHGEQTQIPKRFSK